MTDYLTITEILAMHTILIDRYGGGHGIRDAGAIEAACYRPQSGYYDDHISQAAAIMESLAMNHPFIDGNKRIAFAAADAFLRINGYDLQTDSLTVHSEMIRLFEAGKFEIRMLDKLLRTHTKSM